MRDVFAGGKRKASFVANHFMAICLGLLVLALALTLLTNCGGHGGENGAQNGGAAGPSTRSYDTTVGGGPSTVTTSGSTTVTDGLRTIPYADLPREAKQTIALIQAGGPFPYPRSDDKVFRNLEGLLPKHPRGYYKEYTVPTPGADTRGARRIIRGQDATMYYTSDHYDSFRRIVR